MGSQVGSQVGSQLLAYCAGLVFGLWMPAPERQWPLFAAMALCLTIILVIWLPAGRTRGLCRIALACVVGLAWHGLWATQQLAQRLPVALEGRDLIVAGRIASLPEQRVSGTRFDFVVAEGPPPLIGATLLLTLYDAELPGQSASATAVDKTSGPELRGGQHWRWTVRLKQPRGFANPGAFDYEAWLLQQGYAARGYLRVPVAGSGAQKLLQESGVTLTAWRQCVLDRLVPALGSTRHGAVIRALVLGDRSGLQGDYWTLFAATGTNHLFVISGLHIGLVAMAALALSGMLLRLWHPIGWPRSQLAALAALTAALVYCLLAGFTLPTQRAFIMVTLLLTGRLLRRRIPLALRFQMALAGVLTLNPLASLSAGFWLSFTAVGALVFLQPNSAARSRGIWAWFLRQLRPQLTVFVLLLVPLLSWTGQVALLAPLINLLAIPLVGLLIVPLCLGGMMLEVSISGGTAPLLLADFLLELLFSGLHHAASLGSQLQLEMVPASLPIGLMAGLGCMLWLLPMRSGLRHLTLPMLLPLVLPRLDRPDPGSLEVQVFDVGQGLSVLVRTSDHTLLYDTGAGFSTDFDLASTQVLPALRRQGLNSLDALVISHGDNDHAGGVDSVLAGLPVARLFTSNTELAARTRGQSCLAGQHWTWDGVEFRFLHPDGSSLNRSANNQSCVLQASTRSHSLLLPGDIEADVERHLALELRESLSSTLLIAPHHGSGTSSRYPFLKRVQPQWVVFSAGYRNAFGHPHPDVVSRYQALGVNTVSIAESGWSKFVLTEQGELPQPVRYRLAETRYWRGSGEPGSGR